MTEQERILEELATKAEEVGKVLKHCAFRMKRTKKSLRYCHEACESTNQMIGEMDGRSN